jgi:hypothetical protein
VFATLLLLLGGKKANGCRAHVKAVGDSPDEIYITSMDLTHTCNQEKQRKRNYFTHDITNMSNAIKVWEPASSGNAKQF